VKGKVFVFMHGGPDGLSLSTKLPASHAAALSLPFAEPTHYGLGKSGWVTASFGAKEKPPIGILNEWIEESYRAVAPKKLVATLASGTASDAAKKPANAKGAKTATRRPAARPAKRAK